MEILKIREHSKIADISANWFHSKWGIPLKEYQKNIVNCQ